LVINVTSAVLPGSRITNAMPSPEPIDPAHPDDGEIVRRVLAGDTEAFGVLVARHRPVLLRFALRMLDDQADAEDVVQEALVRGYRALDQCKEPDRVAAWLYAIVVNRCRTRSIQRHRRKQRFVRDEVALARVAARGPDAAEELARREALETALATLDTESRTLFLMKYVDGISYEEMGRIMGLGLSALKMRVSRTRDRLRHLLEH